MRLHRAFEITTCVLLLPLIFLASAIGGIYWVVWTMPFGKNQVDKDRLKGFFGLFTSDMEPHWERLIYSSPLAISDAYENLKNVASEWAKADGQRAAKLMSAFTLIALLLVLLIHL